jgi:hypothetical protein
MNKIIKFNEYDHKSLVLWATDCAEHVLPYFEKEYPEDYRPRKAIEAGRAWVRGEITISEVRIIAFAAHAAARNAVDMAARAVARSAGHAAATAHVVTHASHAADYAVAAAEAVNITGEREWQYKRLSNHLRFIIFPNLD